MKPAEEGAPGWHGRATPSLLPPGAPRLGPGDSCFLVFEVTASELPEFNGKTGDWVLANRIPFLNRNTVSWTGRGIKDTRETQMLGNLTNITIKESVTVCDSGSLPPQCTLFSAPPEKCGVEVKPETDSALWPLAWGTSRWPSWHPHGWHIACRGSALSNDQVTFGTVSWFLI